MRLLLERLAALRDSQLQSIEKVVEELRRPLRAIRLPTSDIVGSEEFLLELGDTLVLHHSFSSEPFTKDRFEYAMERVANRCGQTAQKSPRGTPGSDLLLNGQRISLKTQANAAIRPDTLHISKFMELGKGRWAAEEDLVGLRDQFFQHMNGYDRIVVLRAFHKRDEWFYEMVEIPKALLLKAANGVLSMQQTSQQNPKPGYCTVTEGGAVLFRLYFDGGTERKLQIKDLSKRSCIVHANWSFAG